MPLVPMCSGDSCATAVHVFQKTAALYFKICPMADTGSVPISGAIPWPRSIRDIVWLIAQGPFPVSASIYQINREGLNVRPEGSFCIRVCRRPMPPADSVLQPAAKEVYTRLCLFLKCSIEPSQGWPRNSDRAFGGVLPFCQPVVGE